MTYSLQVKEFDLQSTLLFPLWVPMGEGHCTALPGRPLPKDISYPSNIHPLYPAKSSFTIPSAKIFASDDELKHRCFYELPLHPRNSQNAPTFPGLHPSSSCPHNSSHWPNSLCLFAPEKEFQLKAQIFHHIFLVEKTSFPPSPFPARGPSQRH